MQQTLYWKGCKHIKWTRLLEKAKWCHEEGVLCVIYGVCTAGCAAPRGRPLDGQVLPGVWHHEAVQRRDGPRDAGWAGRDHGKWVLITHYWCECFQHSHSQFTFTIPEIVQVIYHLPSFKPLPVLGKSLQKPNALFITCYCHFKIILIQVRHSAICYFYIVDGWYEWPTIALCAIFNHIIFTLSRTQRNYFLINTNISCYIFCAQILISLLSSCVITEIMYSKPVIINLNPDRVMQDHNAKLGLNKNDHYYSDLNNTHI